ncbi:MAG: hypothetical protein UR26_C0003G0109 [candidate division TM6 bacterium GW2011_GWF2_32_72]|nr:MAG: hypothetical protein UR26_C0003G0109 [candidate division TM6 bacterium GW2011_GWF2_32_72]
MKQYLPIFFLTSIIFINISNASELPTTPVQPSIDDITKPVVFFFIQQAEDKAFSADAIIEDWINKNNLELMKNFLDRLKTEVSAETFQELMHPYAEYANKKTQNKMMANLIMSYIKP